jgi:hypothetical protein
VEVMRGWLERELGDAAVVYHQGRADPLPSAAGAERFSISVPLADTVSLIWLRNKRGPVRSAAMALIVAAVVAEGEMRTEGRHARRNFVLHYRETV